jgi:predicted nucleic-acid-binding protein
VIGLDTNVLVRYLLRDDPVQAARAERELERNERFLIDSIVLCELVWVLETGYGFSRTEIAAALERILATAQFEIESKDLALAALDDFRRSGADFSDCLIGRRNRAAGAPETVTFDRNLKGLEGFRLL